jgi:hypothetical protein
MPRYTFPQSVRKYIRLQKALIRRGVLDMAEQKARISKLYEDMIQKYQTKEVKSQDPVSPKKEK